MTRSRPGRCRASRPRRSLVRHHRYLVLKRSCWRPLGGSRSGSSSGGRRGCGPAPRVLRRGCGDCGTGGTCARGPTARVRDAGRGRCPPTRRPRSWPCWRPTARRCSPTPAMPVVVNQPRPTTPMRWWLSLAAPPVVTSLTQPTTATSIRWSMATSIPISISISTTRSTPAVGARRATSWESDASVGWAARRPRRPIRPRPPTRTSRRARPRPAPSALAPQRRGASVDRPDDDRRTRSHSG
jgi:hypothetical protein